MSFPEEGLGLKIIDSRETPEGIIYTLEFSDPKVAKAVDAKMLKYYSVDTEEEEDVD